MKILRNAIVAAGAASAILTGMTPASAATAAVVEGEATIGCFGCGTYGPAGNSASFRVWGVYDDTTHAGTGGSATFTVNEGTGVGCVVSGTANGSINVGGDVRAFVWTRVGVYASVTVTKAGEATIEADVVFAAHSDATLPCGSRVTATFAGEARAA